jgi:hypothetical protein
MEVDGQRHAPAALPPGKRSVTHFIGEWVGPRAGLNGCRKISSPPGFDLRTVQPVASRYNDINTMFFHNTVNLITSFLICFLH